MILSAKLSRPVRLEIPGKPRAQWPIIAGRYDLLFPDDGTTLAFWFNDDYATQRRGFPKPASFRLPSEFGTRHVVQVDAGCEGGAANAQEKPPLPDALTQAQARAAPTRQQSLLSQQSAGGISRPSLH